MANSINSMVVLSDPFTSVMVNSTSSVVVNSMGLRVGMNNSSVVVNSMGERVSMNNSSVVVNLMGYSGVCSLERSIAKSSSSNINTDSNARFSVMNLMASCLWRSSSSDVSVSAVSDSDVSVSAVSDSDVSVSTVSDSDVSVSTESDSDVSVSTVSDSDVSVSTVSDSDVSVSTVSDSDVSVSTMSDSDVSVSTDSDSDVSVSTVSDSDTHMSVMSDFPSSHTLASSAHKLLLVSRSLDSIFHATALSSVSLDWNSGSGDSICGRNNFSGYGTDNLSSSSVIEDGSVHTELSSTSHNVVGTGLSWSVVLHARADLSSLEDNLSGTFGLWIFDFVVDTSMNSVNEGIVVADRNSVEVVSLTASHLLDSVDVGNSPSSTSLVSVLLGVGNAFVLLDRGVLDNSSFDAFSSDYFGSPFDL
jgi:hypothetical protein